jgi:hypothetical protein
MEILRQEDKLLTCCLHICGLLLPIIFFKYLYLRSVKIAKLQKIASSEFPQVLRSVV